MACPKMPGCCAVVSCGVVKVRRVQHQRNPRPRLPCACIQQDARGCRDLKRRRKRKLWLSTKWADMTGVGLRYFMVFEREAPDADNAFTLAEFGSEFLG